MPVSIGSIMAGRLLADGARLFVQGGAILLLAVALGAEIETGVAGALLIIVDLRRADRQPRAQVQGPGRRSGRSSRWPSC
jgi:hypothetical protein